MRRMCLSHLNTGGGEGAQDGEHGVVEHRWQSLGGAVTGWRPTAGNRSRQRI